MRRSSSRNPGPVPFHCRIRNPVARFPSKSAATLRRKSLPAPDDPSLSHSGKKTQNPKRNAERHSARKLAASMWQAEFQEIKPGVIHLQQPQYDLKHGSKTEIPFSSKIQPFAVLPNPLLERATKWDIECSNPSEEVYRSFDHFKLLMDQQMTNASTLEAMLKAELKWARGRIGELETKRHSSKKKLEAFLNKHAEEKAMWRMREHEKVRAVIDGLRGDLSTERKNQRRTKILNAKLTDELAEAKKSTKRFIQEYEKEKKTRELVEEVCNELAKEVGEDRVEIEEMKMESMRVREELEEERKMLQMAEVWREERVHMKLIDAKQALEDQCVKLKSLGMELEAFLNSNSDVAEIKEAEFLIKAVAEAIKMQDMKTFTYQPPLDSEDIYAIFQELQQREDPKERGIEPCHGDSPVSGASGIESASPATDIFLGKPMNGSVDEDSEWETLSNGDVDSRNSRKSSDDTLKSRSLPCPDIGEIYQKTLVKAIANRRLSKGGSSDIEFSPPNIEPWSSPDSAKSHVGWRMKGCIEWSCSAHKHSSLKAKLLGARLESHKVQIRHVLKQKN